MTTTLTAPSSAPTRLPLAVLAAEVRGRMMCVVIDSYFDEGLAPGLVSVRIPTDDPAWHELRTAPRLGISVLNPLQTIGVANIHHSLTADRDGSALVDGASVHLSTTLYQEFDAGEHAVALLHVLGRTVGDIAPEQREFLYTAA
ncbi:MAG: flavin reductase [Candidatus Corynebacterium faecigallinarum]|uniref:flavin reductase n=1 Tax=Candidatus Corynebacterium faecigallinarum TaxID=2838528 RepID=UPI003FB6AB01